MKISDLIPGLKGKQADIDLKVAKTNKEKNQGDFLLWNMSDLEARDLCKHRIDTMERWSRRLIDEKFKEAYGEDYFDTDVAEGQPLIKAAIKRQVEGRMSANPDRFARKVDALVIEDLEYFFCREDLYKGKDARYYNKFFKDLEEKRILHVDATTQRANWVIVKKAGDNAEIRKRRKVVQTDFAKCCNSIFIDEAQDIDKETYEILKTLDKHGIWIDLVGDPKQDLRGYGYLRTLMDDFPDSVSYVNECYRCPDKILKISNSIIPSSEKQHSGIDGGEIKIIFESQQNNIACIVNSPIYDLRYIYKKNETYNTHDTANKTVIEGLTDIFEDILPNYFAGIASSELRIKRVAYYTACRFIEDNLNGASLSTSIHNTFGGRIKTSEYRKIAIALNACASYQNDKVIIRVDSIERIKGREGKHCLFILTPDLAAYLFGDKTDNNKIKNALYVALTRSLWKFTILVTKETEKKYERTRFKEHFTKLIHTPETYF